MAVSWGNPPVEVDFVVTVPSRYSVNLKTSDGDSVVGDRDGQGRSRLLGAVNGGSVRKLRASGGDMVLGKR